MSDFDMQMVRDGIEGGWNLSIGEPILLQKHLRFPAFEAKGPFQYPTMEGHSGLVEQLKKLHPNIKHVVITNGAKQALSAAFWALQKELGKTMVQHLAPFWPSYPTLARMLGMDFWDGPVHSGDLKVITSPNNPDGSQARAGDNCDVFDGVYAHWVYGWNGVVPNNRIRVGSASKLLGLSGVRLGWALTNDDELAEAMRRYVEFTTSGVSQLAQEYVHKALVYLDEHDRNYAFADARADMLQNGNAFKRILGRHMGRIEGVPENGSGMFAWVAPKAPVRFSRACEEAKVAVVTGEACGASSAWFRLNMCVDTDDTQMALQAIAEKLG